MRCLLPLLLTARLLSVVLSQYPRQQNPKAATTSAPTTSGRCPPTVEEPTEQPKPATEIINVSLHGGTSRCSGWVRLDLGNSSLMGLRLTGSSNAESKLVCRRLGCGDVHSMILGSFFQGRPDVIWEHRLDCWSNHTSLQQCLKVPSRDPPREALGIVCEDARPLLRLGPTLSSCQGILQLYHSGSWRDVGVKPDPQEAENLCQRLHCGRAVAVSDVRVSTLTVLDVRSRQCLFQPRDKPNCAIEGQLVSKSFIYNISCRDALSPAFRLRDGESQCDGKVEVFHRGSWFPVCRGDWGTREGAAVCSQLDCVGSSDSWHRAGVPGRNHSGSTECLHCRDLGLRSVTDNVSLWEIQVKKGAFQQLNFSCPGRPESGTQSEEEVGGSPGVVTAWVLLIVLLLLLLGLAWGWRRYKGDGVGVFRRKQTQRQWIGPTGATSHTGNLRGGEAGGVSFHRNSNANARPVSGVSNSSNAYSLDPTRGLTAYPALERRGNIVKLNRDHSSDSDYDFFEPNTH